MSERCDREVFDNGVSLLAIDGWAKDVEPWVQKIAKHSGQRVDWHYSGGVAHVLVLGDHAKAMASVDALAKELVWVDTDEERFKGSERRNPRIMRRYEPEDRGLYRAGDPLPEGVIGVDSTGASEGMICTDVSAKPKNEESE